MILADAKSNILNGARAATPRQGDFMAYIQRGVSIFIIIIFSVAVIMLIIGGLRYTLSGGDPKATEGAKNTILYALIGVVVAVVATAIVKFVLGWF